MTSLTDTERTPGIRPAAISSASGSAQSALSRGNSQAAGSSVWPETQAGTSLPGIGVSRK